MFVIATALAVAVPLILCATLLLNRQADDLARLELKAVGLEATLRNDAVILALRTLRLDELVTHRVTLGDRLAVERELTRLYDFAAGTGRQLQLDKRLRRLQDQWAQIPERGPAPAAVDATLASAFDLARAIQERSGLHSDTDPLLTSLVDAATLEIPTIEDRADDERALLLSEPSGAGPSRDAALGIVVLAAEADRADAAAIADVQRATALGAPGGDGLAMTVRLSSKWSHFATLASAIARAPRDPALASFPMIAAGDTLLRYADATGRTIVSQARRVLDERIAQGRENLLWLRSGLAGAFVLLLLFAILTARAIRERDRRDLEAARAEAQRLTIEADNRRTRELLALTEARFEAVFERASLGVAILDTDGRIVRTNAALVGLVPQATPADVGAAEPAFADLVAGRRDAFAVEFSPPSAPRKRWIEAVVSLVRDDANAPLFAVAMIKDVTERHDRAERLLWDATHDALVALPNRTALFARLASTLRKPPGTAGVAYVDIDGFELLNESLGHVAGDRILQQVARRLVGASDHDDYIARFGGDEFAVVLENRDGRAQLVDMLERFVNVLSAPFSIDDREVFVTPSVGLALLDGSPISVEEVVIDAQTASVAAKSTGRLRYAVFDAAMRARSQRRLELATQVRRALERDQLHLTYQPIVALSTERIGSFEVLLRWDHPELGLVSPAEFIPIAEDAGMIVPIGRWVFERACAQLARWRGESPNFANVRLSVNASVHEILRTDYCTFVERTIARHGLHPGDITLEITESAILQSDRGSAETLDRLRRAGMLLAIDDFGTGYSSLRYLQSFPFDYLKIDGTFVRGNDGGLASEPIVSMLVALASSTGVSVIAEGVETRQQANALRTLGCASGQGFAFAMPSAASVIPGLLEKGRLGAA